MQGVHPAAGASEAGRIEFLLKRDGCAATRAWVERTVRLYQDALGQQGNLTLDPSNRPRFERAVREFKEWLEATRDAIEAVGSAEEPRSPTE